MRSKEIWLPLNFFFIKERFIHYTLERLIHIVQRTNISCHCLGFTQNFLKFISAVFSIYTNHVYYDISINLDRILKAYFITYHKQISNITKLFLAIFSIFANFLFRIVQHIAIETK